MAEQLTIPAEQVSFKDFLFKNKRNKTILILAGIAMVIQWYIFKYFYPFASFIHGDSFSYLDTAWYNLDINTYMVGYSRFLRLFSVITSSDLGLTTFQYLSIQFGALLLLFTIFYFYKPARVTQYILLIFMVFNPLLWHLGNLVSSDCLFVALSLIWFSLLLWIIHQPNTKIIIWHAVILFIAFTFRYNALIYPFITIIAFYLSSLTLRRKVVGFGLGLFLCGLFVSYTSYKYKNLTGYWQYSPFSGWQLTNNAMYTYRYVDSADRKPVPKKFRAFDNMVRQYFDSTRNTKKFPIEEIKASTFYMWSPSLPMFKYRDSLFKKKDSTASELKKWASMGPFFKSYGLYIIKQYPLKFLQHFIWPNGNKYYAPPVEFLGNYNSGKDEVTEQAKVWFGYKSLTIKTRMKSKKVWILGFYPILSGAINFVMLFMLIFYFLLKGWENNIKNKGIFLAGVVWLLNAAFTIGASSAALRFQSFPILLTYVFVMLLLDWLWKIAINSDNKAKKIIIEPASTRISNEVFA